MIIYSIANNWLAAIDTITKTSEVTLDIDGFFDKHHADIFVTFNGEKEKKRFPNMVIFSSHPDETFIEYCAQNGFNCETNNRNKERACYDVLTLASHFEDIIAPRFNLYTQIISHYRLKPVCFRYSLNQLTKEALGWR